MRTEPNHRRHDPIRRFRRVLVFPHPDDVPPGFGEPSIGVVVASAILLDLRLPELCVGTRPCHMNRASVPEAPVDKDRESKRGIDDVGFSPEFG
jgi:hypothetical protein